MAPDISSLKNKWRDEILVSRLLEKARPAVAHFLHVNGSEVHSSLSSFSFKKRDGVPSLSDTPFSQIDGTFKEVAELQMGAVADAK